MAIALISISPDHGTWEGGTAVTIIGAGLSGVTSVTFGQQAATSVVAVDDGTVTCVTPGAGNGPVEVEVTLG